MGEWLGLGWGKSFLLWMCIFFLARGLRALRPLERFEEVAGGNMILHGMTLHEMTLHFSDEMR